MPPWKINSRKPKSMEVDGEGKMFHSNYRWFLGSFRRSFSGLNWLPLALRMEIWREKPNPQGNSNHCAATAICCCWILAQRRLVSNGRRAKFLPLSIICIQMVSNIHVYNFPRYLLWKHTRHQQAIRSIRNLSMNVSLYNMIFVQSTSQS